MRPSIIEPMLPTLVDEPPKGDDHSHPRPRGHDLHHGARRVGEFLCPDRLPKWIAFYRRQAEAHPNRTSYAEDVQALEGLESSTSRTSSNGP